ncbi:hypothetical protein EGT07_02885 [Herbaspirillum sp. HC18]|nr:hypothetical protein EGT07_02885 [Herbaspirillum sp. HC18]
MSYGKISDVSRETSPKISHMTDPATIFQRTHSGRDEIHQKTHGLTQSERLVLIMVDGVSSFGDIRAKLPSLTDERFDRAFQKLQIKELVLEVFMPIEGQAPEELESTVVDRFLQQDPLDPVTIIFSDPEEELGMLAALGEKQDRAARQVPVAHTAEVPVLIDTFEMPAEPKSPAESGRPEPAVDEHHARLADTLAEEVRARQAARPQTVVRQVPEPAPLLQVISEEQPPLLEPFTSVHWGYWLIVAGTFFILGFVLARMTA